MKYLTRTICSAAIAAASTLALAPGSPVAAAGPIVRQAAVDPVPLPEHLVAPVASNACERDPGDETHAPSTTCELIARAGTADVGNGQVLPVWVFDDQSGGPIDLLNPVIEMFEGDTLVVKFQNDIPGVNVGFSLPVTLADGQLAPDVTGLGEGAGAELTFSGLTAGTYVYQPSPTPDANRQLAMGMGGIIIVRPAGYDPADTTTHELAGGLSWYTDEVVAVLHEFDPAFNADPMHADLAQFTPSVFTLNGRSYDGATPLPQVQQGARVLVRAANLGLMQRRVGFTGARIEQVTQSSRPLLRALDQAAITVPPGDVADGLSTLPLTAGTNVALFDHHLSNWQDAGSAPAGQARVWEIPGAGSPVGPVITDARFAAWAHGVPVFDGSTPALFEVESEPGASVRYFVDDLGAAPTPATQVQADGIGTGVIAPQGAPGAPALSELANGDHVLWVQAGRGDPGAELWGPVYGVLFEMYRTGPVITGLTADPSTIDGVNVGTLNVTGTADTTLTGPGSDVQVVRYTIDAPPQPDGLGNFDAAGGTDAVFDGDNPQRASFTAEIDVASLGLAEGSHTVYVFAKDSASQIVTGEPLGLKDHWSQVVGEVTFTIDATAPTLVADTLAITPNPNNGTLAYDGSQIFLDAVRLSATFTDGTNSPIVDAEFGLGDPATVVPGTGDPLQSTTAQWGDVLDGSDPAEYVQSVYADIPLADVRALPEGLIDVWVRVRDAAGNWSDAGQAVVQLVHDITPPEVTVTSAGAGQVVFDVVDPAVEGAATPVATPAGPASSTIVSIEWFVGADPGAGARNAVPLDPATPVSDLTGVVLEPVTAGDVVTLIVTDAAGNAATVTVDVLDITPPVVTLTDTGTGDVVVDVADTESNIVSVTADTGAGPVDLGAPGDATTFSAQLTGLADGTPVEVVATDAAGNVTTESLTVAVLPPTPPPDTLAPVLTDLGGNAGEVNVDVSDDSGELALVEYWDEAAPAVVTQLVTTATPSPVTVNVTGLAEGAQITVRAQDAAGNETVGTFTAVPPPAVVVAP